VARIRAISPAEFKYRESYENLIDMIPMFYSDLKFIKDLDIVDRIIDYIIEAVKRGEEKFKQAFGGWDPMSNQFGIATLRPHHVDHPTADNNRWLWTSGGTSTIHSLGDTWINVTLADDEMILIYGYFNLEAVPNTVEIWVQPGTTKLPIQNIQPMRMKEEDYFIFPEMVLVEPRSPLKIMCSCISTNVTEEMGLLGYIFAPASKLIQE